MGTTCSSAADATPSPPSAADAAAMTVSLNPLASADAAGGTIHRDPALENSTPAAPEATVPSLSEVALVRPRAATGKKARGRRSVSEHGDARGFLTPEPTPAEAAARVARMAGIAYVHGINADPCQFSPEPVSHAVIHAASARCADWLPGVEPHV